MQKVELNISHLLSSFGRLSHKNGISILLHLITCTECCLFCFLCKLEQIINNQGVYKMTLVEMCN